MTPALRPPPPADPLLERARAGDVDAFVALLREHDDAMRGLAWRLLGDRTRMDDVLQEAYTKAFRALGEFRGEAAARTWLHRIVYNTCLDELRRDARRPVVPLDAVSERPAPGTAFDDRLALREQLTQALDALPPEQRAAVLLVDGDGYDYAAAGEVLGVPAGTVGSRVSRGRATLRHLLTGIHEGDQR